MTLPYECFGDPLWRISHLYKIVDAYGAQVTFKPNPAQLDFYHNLHEQNVVLKARQLGFSTFILIYALDHCLFNPNNSAGVIAQGLTEAEDLFRNKVKYAYDHLPRWLKRKLGATSDSARKLEFTNGSSIQVGTSLRGGTFQILHVSEYGKIAARYPDKAREIKTGALNTVHAGQRIFIESTAEGQFGEFYDLVMRGRALQQQGIALTPLDPKVFFYGWNWKDSYRMSGDVSLDEEDVRYFRDLREKEGIELDSEQKSWYVKKAQQQGEYMKREYPSTPDEAFEQSMEGAYFTKQMMMVRKNNQIRSIDYEPMGLVDTWWDLGMNDSMVIWFFQQIGNEYRFIDYFEADGEGIEFYAQVLRDKGYYYGVHYWPHDGNVRDLSTGRHRHEVARGHGINNIKVLPRTKWKNDDIQALRTALPRFHFDDTRCAVGIRHVDNYRKEWNDKLGTWKDSPLHNDASHGVDPLLNFAVHYRGRREELTDISERVTMAEDYDLFAV